LSPCENADFVYISHRNTNKNHQTSETVQYIYPIDNWSDWKSTFSACQNAEKEHQQTHKKDAPNVLSRNI